MPQIGNVLSRFYFNLAQLTAVHRTLKNCDKKMVSTKTNHSRTKAYSWQKSAPKNKLIL